MDQDVDFVCVFSDSGLYELQRDYFDSFEVLFRNSAGFVARVEPGVFDQRKA